MATYRTQLQEYWHRRRVAVLVTIVLIGAGLASVPVVLFATSAILRGVRELLVDLVAPARAAQIQIFATIGNLAIGVVLVAVTAFYAWITRATLHELTEARRVARQPTVLVSAKDPQLIPSSVDMFHATVEVVNAGVAVAIRPIASVTTPHYPPPVPDEPWFHPSRSVTSTIFGLPLTLPPGGRAQHHFDNPIEVNDLPEGRLASFTQLVVAFEDLDKNLYKLVQEYDLFVVQRKPIMLSLRYERLTMLQATIGDRFVMKTHRSTATDGSFESSTSTQTFRSEAQSLVSAV